MEIKNYDKYLLISGLQKSIRFGLTENAIEITNFLFENEKNYLQYRLGIILTEDIGIANIPLLTEYLNTEIKNKNIEENGGIDFIHKIVKMACESPKDRSSSDISYLASFEGLMNTATDKNFCYSILAESLEPLSQTKIIWKTLLQHNIKKFQNNILNLENINLNFLINDVEDKNIEKQFLLYMHNKISNIENISIFDKKKYLSKNKENLISILNIFEKAYQTQSEPICMGLIPIYNHFLYEKENSNLFSNVCSIIERNKTDITDFDNLIKDNKTGLFIPSSSIDGHTYFGKIILNNLYKNTEIKNILKYENETQKENILNLLKYFLFRLDGQHVNKRLYFPTAVSVMHETTLGVYKHKIKNIYKSIDSDKVKIDIKQIQEIFKENKYIISEMREDSFKMKNKFSIR